MSSETLPSTVVVEVDFLREMSISEKSSRSNFTIEKKDEEKKETKTLSRILSEAFACVLEETSDKLSVIVNVADFPKIKEIKSEENKMSVGEDLKEICEIFDPETIQPLEEALNYQNLVKFQNEIIFLEELLRKTSFSLLKTNSFDILSDFLMEFKKNEKDKTELLDSTEKFKKKVIELRKTLKTETKKANFEIEKTKKIVSQLKQEIEEKLILKRMKLNYVDKWEKSRKEQNTFILTTTENKIEEVIRSKTADIKREERINNEIEQFIHEQQQDYENEIQNWMERYDREMEQLDLDIQRIHEQIEEQEIKNVKIKQELADRQKFIEEWLVHKEIKRLQKERFDRITEASMAIQCWWRSVMVKKRLGPYGKKKGKGKGKGKGKK